MNKRVTFAVLVEILISGLLVLFVVGPLSRTIARNFDS